MVNVAKPKVVGMVGKKEMFVDLSEVSLEHFIGFTIC